MLERKAAVVQPLDEIKVKVKQEKELQPLVMKLRDGRVEIHLAAE